MNQELLLHTAFHSVADLAEGLRDRIGDDQLILYGPIPPIEGEQVSFAIALEDGSMALQGAARVSAAVDGGTDRDPEARYDIVLEGLQLDAAGRLTFHRMLATLHGAATYSDAGDESTSVTEADDAHDLWQTADVEALDSNTLDEGPDQQSQNRAASAANQAAPHREQGRGDQPRSDRPRGLAARSEPAPAPAAELPETGLQALTPGVYEEPSIALPSWDLLVPPIDPNAKLTLRRPSRRLVQSLPEAPVREPRPSSGLFLYPPGTLPIPSAPPRPDGAVPETLFGASADAPRRARTDALAVSTRAVPTADLGDEFEDEVYLQSLSSDIVEEEAEP